MTQPHWALMAMTHPEPEQTGRAGFSFLTCRNDENLITDSCCFKPLGLGMTCYVTTENWRRLCKGICAQSITRHRAARHGLSFTQAPFSL